jgi:hypothetical protein
VSLLSGAAGAVGIGENDVAARSAVSVWDVNSVDDNDVQSAISSIEAELGASGEFLERDFNDSESEPKPTLSGETTEFWPTELEVEGKCVLDAP